MAEDLEHQRARTPVLRKAAAGLVLVAVGALLIHFIVGLVVAVFWIAVILAAVVAVVWALKTIIW
jgi:Flp pilus assembly protein TadB